MKSNSNPSSLCPGWTHSGHSQLLLQLSWDGDPMEAATHLTTAPDRDLNNSVPVNPYKLVNTASSYLEIFHYPGVSNKLIERASQSSSTNHASEQQHQVVCLISPSWSKGSL